MARNLVCAWCNAAIGESVFMAGLRMLPGHNLGAHEGRFIALPLSLLGKAVPAYVTEKGSDAKNAGYDAVIIICSESCREQLNTALRNEKKAGFLSLN